MEGNQIMHTISVTISSLTGNTQKIANVVLEELQNTLNDVVKNEGIKVKIFQNKELLNLPELDGYILLFFWCRKSAVDDYSKEVLKQCKGKRILAFGTMGGYPDGIYGQQVRENVKTVIEENNICEGVYLSQGKIPEARTKYRRSLPIGHPHYLDEKGLKRHEESRKHPNTNDLKNAVEFFREHFMMSRV